jgi:hypothetical protein
MGSGAFGVLATLFEMGPVRSESETYRKINTNNAVAVLSPELLLSIRTPPFGSRYCFYTIQGSNGEVAR